MTYRNSRDKKLKAFWNDFNDLLSRYNAKFLVEFDPKQYQDDIDNGIPDLISLPVIAVYIDDEIILSQNTFQYNSEDK